MAMLADCNLLFGVVALQMNFITRAQLLAALNAAVSAKDPPLGEILVQQGALSVERRALLEALVQEQMKQHGGDPHQSLAALSVGAEGRSLRAELERITDADPQPSLAHAPAGSADDDPAATRTGSAAAPTGTGTRYRILRPHAEGGLGKVFVARDEELHRDVALKEIKERHADNPECRARFIMEAEITGGLEHPGIVPVYGLGAYADGRPFYAMRFIRGDSLKDAIGRFHKRSSARFPDYTEKEEPSALKSVKIAKSVDYSSLGFRQLLGRFVDVCNAVAYAHSRGVLHRDLKPGNIMLGKYGETLVVDWGLAKAGLDSMAPAAPATAAAGVAASTVGHEQLLTPAAGSGTPETTAGSAVGTPQYMSPEQAAGRLDLLGAATDVYSLGATLYCILTGKAPIEESDVGAILRKVQKGDFPPPRQVQGHVPRALDAVCLRAMALRPGDRYRSPRDLADDVERWLADERVLAYPEPMTARLGRWARRHRTAVSAAAGLLLASAILLGISTATFREMHRHADDLRDRADKALRAGQRSAYINAIRLAHEHWEDSDPQDIPALLANAGPPELRSWEWGHLNHLLRGPFRTLPFPPQAIATALSADGTRFAAAASDGTIKVWDVPSGRERFTLHAGLGPQLVFSADNKQLAAASAVWKSEDKENWTEVKTWNMDRGQATSAAYIRACRGPRAMSPDATRMVGPDRDGKVKVWDIPSGRELFALGSPIGPFAFSADGKRVAAAVDYRESVEQRKGRWGEVNVWEIATGKKLVVLRDQWYRVTALDFHPSLEELAIGTDNGLVARWDLAQPNASKRPLWEHTGAIQRLAHSRDGSWLASGGADRAITLVNLRQTAEPIRKLRGHFSPVNGLEFVSDKTLISAGAAIHFWDLARAPDCLRLPISASHLAFDPSRSTLISSGPVVKLLDVRDTAGEAHPLDAAVKARAGSAAAVNRKGDRLAIGGADGSITIQDFKSSPAVVVQGHKALINRLVFSPVENGPLASAGDDGAVKLWDTTGRELFTLLAKRDRHGGMAFSPDGKRLATGGGDGVVRLWDIVSGRETAALTAQAGSVWGVAFHPKGGLLATAHALGDASVVKLWQLPSGRELTSLKGHSGVITIVDFTPDGRRLVTAATDSRIKLWDFVDGHEVFEINLFTLLEGPSAVRALAFSPDGLMLAAAAGAQVLLWKALPWDTNAWDTNDGEDR